MSKTKKPIVKKNTPVKKPAKRNPAKKLTEKKVAATKKPSAKKSMAPNKTPADKPAKTAPSRKASTRKSSTRKTISPEHTIAKLTIQALEDMKGKNIVEINVQELTDVMDILIIASGTSNRHVKSLADNVVTKLKKSGHKVYGIEGQDMGEWVLVDLGGVVLHVMQPHIREFYDLERLWSKPDIDHHEN